MADWNDLTAYLKDTFKIINEQDGMLAMGWNLETGALNGCWFARRTPMEMG